MTIKLSSKGEGIHSEQFRYKRLPPTWHALQELPEQDEFFRGLVGDEDNKAAMELVSDLMSRTASETLGEITSSSLRLGIVNNSCATTEGWLHVTISNTQVRRVPRKASPVCGELILSLSHGIEVGERRKCGGSWLIPVRER